MRFVAFFAPHERVLVGEHLGIGRIGHDAQIPGGDNRERGLFERTVRHVGEEVLDDACVFLSCDGKEPVDLLRQRGIQRRHRSADALADRLVQAMGNQQQRDFHKPRRGLIRPRGRRSNSRQRWQCGDPANDEPAYHHVAASEIKCGGRVVAVLVRHMRTPRC